MSSKIKVDTIENVAGSGNVSLGSGHNLVVPGNITGQGTAAITSNATVGGTLGVTGATTTTGGVTIPASTTVGLNFGSGTNLAQLAMQSAVLNRVALRTTHTSTGDNNPFIVYQPSSAGVQNDALVVQAGGQINMSKQPYISLIGNSETEVKSQGSASVYTNFNEGGTGTTRGITWNSSNGRITVPVAGTYLVNVTIYFWCDNAAFHGGHIRINGTTKQEMGVEFDGVQGGRNDLPSNYSKIFTLAASDYIDFYMNGDIYGGPNHTTCEVTMIG